MIYDYQNIPRNIKYSYSIDKYDNKNYQSNINDIKRELYNNVNNNSFKKDMSFNKRIIYNNNISNSSRSHYSQIINPTFNYKIDLKNLGINLDNNDIINNDNYKSITPQYYSNNTTLYNSTKDSNQKSLSNLNVNNSFYNNKNQNYINTNEKYDNNNVFSGLSELTKIKLRQIELSKNNNNLLNNNYNNFSFFNKKNSIRNIYKPINTILNDSDINDNQKIENEKKRLKNKNNKTKRVIKTIINEKNDNYQSFNKGILYSPNKSNPKINQSNREINKEKNIELEKIKFNKKVLKIEKPINENIFNVTNRSEIQNEYLENEFNKYLKEENEKLKQINYTYKQLLDSFFYFMNNLSHKFSYYEKLFDISYYLNRSDDLSKTLIGLENCILSHYKKKKFDKLNNIEINKPKFIQNLKLINEISIQLPKPIEIKNNIKKVNNYINNLKKPLFSFKGINNNIIREEKTDLNNKIMNNNDLINSKSLNFNEPNFNNKYYNLKDKSDCIACNLGCSISQRGYSQMTKNPYITNTHSNRSISN